MALSLLAASTPSFAQSDENRVAARSLATEGAQAFRDGRFKDAVDLFTKAESLVDAPTHLLYIARANAQLGHFVMAREAYLKIIKEQLLPTAPQAFQDAQSAANDELPAIVPKIGRLTIKLVGGDGAADLALTLDGQPIPAVLVGIAQPIDPGEHTVTAKATGMIAPPAHVAVHDAERLEVSLTLGADPNYHPAVPATGATPEATAPGASMLAQGGDQGVAGPMARPIPTKVWIAAGATGALTVGAIVTGVVALGKRSDYNKINDGTHTEADKQSAHDSAATMGLVNTVFSGAAIVGAGVTAYLFFSRPRAPARDHIATVVAPWIAPGGGGLFVGGVL